MEALSYSIITYLNKKGGSFYQLFIIVRNLFSVLAFGLRSSRTEAVKGNNANFFHFCLFLYAMLYVGLHVLCLLIFCFFSADG